MDRRREMYLPAGCVVLLLLLLVAIPANSESPPCKLQDCPNFRAIRHHEELGCKRSDDSDECCPTRFNCSSLLSLEKTKCHYRGKSYDTGTQIQEEIKSVCTPSCVCVNDQEDSSNGEASFHCAHADCPEYFAVQQLPDDCYRSYNVHQCCATGIHCENPPESRKEVALCTYNGRTYFEGQYMEVSDSDCLSCVCQAGFNGTLDSPWCRKFNCDYTLGRRPTEMARCAPVFWENRKCCPISWHCPTHRDAVIRRSEPPTEDDEQCSFGDHRLKIGDELHTNNIPCIKCQCDIPPFITCTQFPDTECDPIADSEEYSD